MSAITTKEHGAHSEQQQQQQVVVLPRLPVVGNWLKSIVELSPNVEDAKFFATQELKVLQNKLEAFAQERCQLAVLPVELSVILSFSIKLPSPVTTTKSFVLGSAAYRIVAGAANGNFFAVLHKVCDDEEGQELSANMSLSSLTFFAEKSGRLFAHHPATMDGIIFPKALPTTFSGMLDVSLKLRLLREKPEQIVDVEAEDSLAELAALASSCAAVIKSTAGGELLLKIYEAKQQLQEARQKHAISYPKEGQLLSPIKTQPYAVSYRELDRTHKSGVFLFARCLWSMTFGPRADDGTHFFFVVLQHDLPSRLDCRLCLTLHAPPNSTKNDYSKVKPLVKWSKEGDVRGFLAFLPDGFRLDKYQDKAGKLRLSATLTAYAPEEEISPAAWAALAESNYE
jgi:hypothetical protein